MKKLLVAAIAVSAIATAGASAYGFNAYKNQHKAQQPSAQVTASQTKQVTISSDGKTVSYDGVEGVTALATLTSLTAVRTQSSSYGDMVTGINGSDSDGKTNYWAFYVNGKLASEGAGTYKAAPGDKIEWRLEKL